MTGNVPSIANNKGRTSLSSLTSNSLRAFAFTPRAEDKCLSVACSSIISRYTFINEMNKLSKEIDMIIPKGASTIVDDFGKRFVEKYGKDKLREVAKLNFKNTEKILI